MFPTLNYLNQKATLPQPEPVNLPAQPQNQPPVLEKPVPLPFLAQKMDKNNQPYYGEGFQGWARKTFANVFAPSDYTQGLDQQRLAQMPQETANLAQNIEASTKWSQWGEKLFGLSAKDIAEPIIAKTEKLQQAKRENNPGEAVAQATGEMYRASKEALWTGLGIIGGTIGWATRKVYAINAASQEIGSLVAPDPIKSDPLYKQLVESNWIGRDLYALNAAANPGMVLRNTAQALTAIATGKITPFKALDTYKAYLAGSETVFTLLTEQSAKNEYLQRYQNGEPADFLVQEIQNPTTDLLMGIATDPSTYFGLPVIGDIGKASTPIRLFGKDLKLFGVTQKVPWRIVARIPTLGEVFHFGASAQRASAMSRYWPDGDMAKAIEKLGNVADEPGAIQKIATAAEQTVQTVEKYASDYRITTLTADGKASVLGRDAKNIVSLVATHTSNLDETLQILSDAAKLGNKATTHEERLAVAAKLWKNPAGQLMLSEAGMQTSAVLGKLKENGSLVKLIEDGQKNPAELQQTLVKLVGKVTEEMMPSVDEMWDAAKAVKEGSKDEKIIALADKYKDLPWYVKGTRAATSRYEKDFYNAVAGGMGKVYIGLNSAFPMRNILGQSVQIAYDMGAGKAAEISTEAATMQWFDKTTELAVSKYKQQQVDMLGFAVDALDQGIGSHGMKKTGLLGVDFGHVASNGERITSQSIGTNTVWEEIQKALNSGVIPDLEALTSRGLTKEQGQLLVNKVLKYNGNSTKALNEFREVTKTGKIEAWREINLPKRLENFLQKTGNLDEVKTIQATAKSQVEFETRVNEVLNRVKDVATKSVSLEHAALSHDVPQEILETGMLADDLANKKVINNETADGFKGLVQSYQNMRKTLEEAVLRSTVSISNLMPRGAPELSTLSDDLSKVSGEFNDTYPYVNQVRDTVNEIYNRSKRGEAIPQLWNEAKVSFRVGGKQKVFSLAELMPDVKTETMTREDFHNVLWTSYFEFSGNLWREANVKYYDDYLNILDDAAKYVGKTLDELAVPQNGQNTSLFKLAAKYRLQADELAKAGVGEARALDASLRGIPRGTSLGGAVVPQWIDFKGGRTRLFRAVNADRAAHGLEPYASMGDVPYEEWTSSLRQRFPKMANNAALEQEYKTLNTKLWSPDTSKTELDALRKRMAEIDNILRPVKAPPPYAGNQTFGRIVYEQLDGFAQDMQGLIDTTKQSWGKTIPTNSFTPEIENALSSWKKVLDDRMLKVKSTAVGLAVEKRNFILHDYNKTYLERAVGYIAPFSYWQLETYTKMLSRFVDSPGALGAYLHYRDYAQKIHADLPEWWKYNVALNNIPGFDPEHPFYINLEATVNPLNTLTGVDFNDPNKRVDWLSSTVDDLNKFGPSLMTPIQWGVALELYAKGENDAAQRWAGRLLPQGPAIKSALTMAGANINIGPVVQHNEIDPIVNLLDGGLDPYEKKRVERALSVMPGTTLQDGTVVTKEMALDAGYNQSGPVWDEAIRQATLERAPGTLSAAILGVGFKGRSANDMQIDKFYNEMGQLYALAPTLSPEDYQRGWKELGTKYPFMDTLLLAKKGSTERDAAFAYNVLGRLPPATQSNVLSTVGLSNKDINQFYDSKGFTDPKYKITDADRMRFMSGILDLAAMTAIPTDATRQEWDKAKSVYKQLDNEIVKQLNDPEIWNKVDTWYSLKDSNGDAAQQFMDMHPEVQQAMDMRRETVITNPILKPYYGGLDKIESYWNGAIREEMISELGKDIYDKWNKYYELQIEDAMNGTKTASPYYKSHPELKRYGDLKAKLQLQAEEAIAHMANALPKAPGTGIRPEFQPQSSTQEALLQAIQPQQAPTWAELSQLMSPAMQNLVLDHFQKGKKLPSVAVSQLDYIASTNGIGTGNDLLQLLANSLYGQ